jgi:hypothetical protein
MPRKCPVADGDVGMQGCILDVNPQSPGFPKSYEIVNFRESDLN